MIIIKTNDLRADMASVGINSTKMARIIGVKPSTFSRKINGFVPFNPEEIAKISKACNMNANRIVDIFLNYDLRENQKEGL